MSRRRPRAWDAHPTNPSRCPWCRARIDSAATAEGVAPRPGDLTICIHCAGVLVFDDHWRVRRPTSAELAEIRSGELWGEIEGYREAVKKLHRT